MKIFWWPHVDHRLNIERSWRSLDESLAVLRASYSDRGSMTFAHHPGGIIPVYRWDEDLIAQCEQQLRRHGADRDAPGVQELALPRLPEVVHSDAAKSPSAAE